MQLCRPVHTIASGGTGTLLRSVLSLKASFAVSTSCLLTGPLGRLGLSHKGTTCVTRGVRLRDLSVKRCVGPRDNKSSIGTLDWDEFTTWRVSIQEQVCYVWILLPKKFRPNKS